MKNKVMKTIVAMLVALTCTVTLAAPVLGTGAASLRITKTGIYDGGGSGG